MKKITLIALMILSLIIIFAFSGCGANENPNEGAQTGGSGQAEETSDAPETEDVSELKEMFAEKIGYALCSGFSTYIKELEDGPLSDKETNEYLFRMGVMVSKPYQIEKKNEYWNDDFERTLTYRLSDIDESLKYVFNKTIDYEILKKDPDFDWAGGNVDFEKEIYVFKEGSNVISRALRRDFGKAEIKNISKNEDGTYEVDFYKYQMRFISESHILVSKTATATVSGKDGGYSILGLNGGDQRLFLDYNSVEHIVFENETNGEYSKKIDYDRSYTTTDGRLPVHVRFNTKTGWEGEWEKKYKKGMHELLEQVGADPELCYYDMYSPFCVIVVTPDQLKEIVMNKLVDYVQFRRMENFDHPYQILLS